MTRYTSHELRTEQREIAREMRRGPTSAEARLWERLRARRLNGLKFSRQHPIGRFIVDLYCVDAGLVIELDGSVHDDPEQRQADVVRQQFLESQGVRVLRFPN
ncbi:MAG TPA: endonuclease domain-containing protein, partial [Dehalococcoidia bacterium]|nr:endonuclease domain-containing protein [Dehalococcoidia bacterium]